VSLIALCITQKKAKFVLVKETVFVVNANVLRKTVADTLANTARNAQYEPLSVNPKLVLTYFLFDSPPHSRLAQVNARNIPRVFSVKYLNLVN
jgi:hypothetical protein